MYDWSTVKEEFTHSAKVGRTVIKNWSKIQQRAVHVIGYTTTESYHNSGGTSWEIGLEGEVKQADDSDDGKTDDALDKGIKEAADSGEDISKDSVKEGIEKGTEAAEGEGVDGLDDTDFSLSGDIAFQRAVMRGKLHITTLRGSRARFWLLSEMLLPYFTNIKIISENSGYFLLRTTCYRFFLSKFFFWPGSRTTSSLDQDPKIHVVIFKRYFVNLEIQKFLYKRLKDKK